jgi:hypothetical protein
MKILSSGLVAAACASAVLAAPAFAGPTVSIRVEARGAGTLVPTTQVALGDGTFKKNPSNAYDCAQTSIAGALEAATAGDWGGAEHPAYGQQIDRIKSVNFPVDPGDRYWAVYVNRGYATGGNCDPVQQGDEIVLTAACGSPSATDCWSGHPLELRAPTTVKPGEAFGVDVRTLRSNPDYSVGDAPAAGATVSGGGASATTGADGRATLVVGERGPVTLTASSENNPRHAIAICVTDGADGYCGTTSPTGQSGLGGPAPTSSTPFIADRIAPKGFVTSLRRNQEIPRSKAPKLLKGRVDESGGVLMVKLRLTRTTSSGRCSAYSGKRERFVRRPRCGAETGWWFRIGDRADWEYQLASKLAAGRYVLDVNVIDKSYNRDDKRRPGENRVVFTVL